MPSLYGAWIACIGAFQAYMIHGLISCQHKSCTVWKQNDGSGTTHLHTMVVQATMNKDVGYDFAVDIWSLGFTIIELFTGKHSWSGLEVVILLDYEHKT
ncbi:hypothetical protein MA16_Dca027538 [Dendrobium catenatum]|uniref:Protein kinase domain-containing protein n=1 Tax=Dendrobium catenatum TaxID=906689 RepID=A0A2I0VH31_9ASPA|nr:hypothetical protein MA16_Dca027538 [Dendrobium catenatum]